MDNSNSLFALGPTKFYNNKEPGCRWSVKENISLHFEPVIHNDKQNEGFLFLY